MLASWQRLATAGDQQTAAVQVEVAVRQVREQGGDLLDLLAAENPTSGSALMLLAEPVAVLGPLPDWVGEVVMQMRSRLEQEEAIS